MKKLCNTAASIVFVKDATNIGKKTPVSSQIHALSAATTILQARAPSTRMVFAKKIASTSPFLEFQLHIGIAILAISMMKEFTSGMVCLNTGMAVFLVLKR